VRICDTVGTSRATLIDEPRPVGRAATRVPPGWTRTVHRGPAPFTASAAPRLSSRPRTRHHPRTTPPPRRAKTRRVSLVGVAMAYWSPWKNRRAATVGSNFSFRRPTTNTRTHRRTRCMRERVAVCDRAVASPPRAFARASGAQHGDLRTRCAWIARASRTHSRGPPHGPDVVAAMWRRRLPPIARQSGLCARTARLLRASPPASSALPPLDVRTRCPSRRRLGRLFRTPTTSRGGAAWSAYTAMAAAIFSATRGRRGRSTLMPWMSCARVRVSGLPPSRTKRRAR
jgi:hypothetical protein